jgi:predicted DNA-binding helix-hairpin-helix protein
MNYEAEAKDALYKKVLNVQQDILMKQYDIEWDEIKFKSSNFVKEITDPYIKRIVKME